MNQQQLKHIKEQLTKVFHPEKLIVADESHYHIGHRGAKEGKGHFSVEITAKAFRNRNQLECHRLIYEALGNLMKTDIHALRIRVFVSN